uniref:Si:ch211-129c21.1 n=1 Tax=Oreochromis niloticus TaxID=8128 RepID=I3J2X0_ORENI
MSLLLALSIICGLMLHVSAVNTDYCVPRKTVPYQNELKLFREEGIYNYSTMLMREDLGVMLLGAREAIYALNMSNISVKNATVYWRVTEDKQRDCTYKGKSAEVECRNYIRTLHRVNDSTMYVCGTNAFSPTCDYLTFAKGQLTLQGKPEEGKGKCPFDPFQRYSSLMVGNDLYSATSINFLGSEPVVLRSSNLALRTEFKSSWLNEPNFVYMDFVDESFDSPDGDDDKVYLFFSENAIEYDFYRKVSVSRVARVCKGDMGGQRTLQRKWTSFLKARLDCSLSEPSLPSIVQDVFLLRHKDWRKMFADKSSGSYCSWRVDIFNEGKFKTSVAVETSHVKWVMYTGEVPVPRPGACINNMVRKMGMNRSLDLPDKTLQFIRDRPLMDEAVRPLTGGPLLITKGAPLTRIVVDSVQGLDGEKYNVMFIGTGNGYVQKAVNYDGEMFIIEEVQLYENHEPISILRLSSTEGQVYAGSTFGAVQMPVSNCSRYETCVDCILARDPYCAWDLSTKQCSSVNTLSPSPDTIQSLKKGDVSQCPPLGTLNSNNIQLPCQLHSNLAVADWRFGNHTLHSNNKYYIYSGGLLILSASETDAGQYSCDSVEEINGQKYNQTVAVYRPVPGLTIDEPLSPASQNDSEVKLLGPESGRPYSANNNHPAVDFKGNGEHHFPPMANISSLDGLGYINDESEI